MKSLFFFLCSLLISLIGKSQQVYFPFDEPSAFFEITDSLNFEDQSDIVLYNNDTIWQVGPPQKLIFSQSWSNPNVLITGKSLPYPDDVNTSVVFSAGSVDSENFFISWNQVVDIGIGDSCIVELSVDSLNWHNITEFESIINPATWFDLYFYQTDLGSGISQFAAAGEDCFLTNTTQGWLQYSLWFYVPSGSDKLLSIDNLYIRFRFISDENTFFQEGWMIDNIYTGSFYIAQSIDDHYKNLQFTTMPNPADDELFLRCEDCMYPLNVRCFDVTGRLVLSSRLNNNMIDTRYLQNGNYILHVTDGTGRIAHRKIMISR